MFKQIGMYYVIKFGANWYVLCLSKFAQQSHRTSSLSRFIKAHLIRYQKGQNSLAEKDNMH